VVCGIVFELEAGEEDVDGDVDCFTRVVQVGAESLVLLVKILEHSRYWRLTLLRSIIRQNNMTSCQSSQVNGRRNLQVSRIYGIGFLLPGKYPLTTCECSSNIPRIPCKMNAKSSLRCYKSAFSTSPFNEQLTSLDTKYLKAFSSFPSPII
jgi:hypothetical protein